VIDDLSCSLNRFCGFICIVVSSVSLAIELVTEWHAKKCENMMENDS